LEDDKNYGQRKSSQRYIVDVSANTVAISVQRHVY